MAVTDIEKRLAEHRAKAFITCEETCMCWDIEKLLFLLETTRLTPVAADNATLSAHEHVFIAADNYARCVSCKAPRYR